jgi:KDO2-lipid IV(A) lauroyltransferase
VSLREDGVRLTAIYWAYRLLERVAMALPERVGRPLFDALGRLAHRLMPGVRGTVAANQARVLGLPPEHPLVRQATLEAFRLYARYWYDTFHVRALTDEEVLRRTRFEGIEHLRRALEQGRGCVAVIPHMGNWDVAGRWLKIMGYRVVAVAEVLRPRRLTDLFVRHRRELGMEIVPLEPGSGVGRRLASLLAENRIVALVADRDLSGRGIEVEMFGARRRLPSGPATLAISSGAPLLVCSSATTEQGWAFRVEPLEVERTGDLKADVATVTRAIAERFERQIAANPPDWHVFQPAWP